MINEAILVMGGVGVGGANASADLSSDWLPGEMSAWFGCQGEGFYQL